MLELRLFLPSTASVRKSTSPPECEINLNVPTAHLLLLIFLLLFFFLLLLPLVLFLLLLLLRLLLLLAGLPLLLLFLRCLLSRTRSCTQSLCTLTFPDNRVSTLYSTQCIFFKRKENTFLKTSKVHRVEYRVDTRLSEKVKVQRLRVHVRVRHKRSWRISRSVPLSTPSPRTREVLL